MIIEIKPIRFISIKEKMDRVVRDAQQSFARNLAEILNQKGKET